MTAARTYRGFMTSVRLSEMIEIYHETESRNEWV